MLPPPPAASPGPGCSAALGAEGAQDVHPARLNERVPAARSFLPCSSRRPPLLHTPRPGLVDPQSPLGLNRGGIGHGGTHLCGPQPPSFFYRFEGTCQWSVGLTSTLPPQHQLRGISALRDAAPAGEMLHFASQVVSSSLDGAEIFQSPKRKNQVPPPQGATIGGPLA